MRLKLSTVLPFAMAATVGLAILSSQTWGDIIETSELRGSTTLFQRTGESVGPQLPLRIRCWQDGREIIDQSGLHGMSLKPLFEQESVSFKRKGTNGIAVHIISVDDTVCLVQAG